MSQKRNIVNKQIYAFCVFVETINGKEEEQKTVVPKRWLDKKNSLLWWPRGINVTSKKFSDPNESSWKQYKLIEVLMEGDESLCNDLLFQSTASESEPIKTTNKTIIAEELPKKPITSVMSIMSTKRKSLSPRLSRSPSLFSTPTNSEPTTSRSCSPSRQDQRTLSHCQIRSRTRSHSRSRSRSRSCSRSRSRSRSRSPSHFSSSAHSLIHSSSQYISSSHSRSASQSHSSRPHTHSHFKSRHSLNFSSASKNARKDSASSLKQKFPMDQGEFQRRVLSLLSESHNRRRAGCQCPCSCGNENKQEGEKEVDKELEKIESLEGFVNMEKMLENRENFDKLVIQLKKLGGKTMKENTKNVMTRLMAFTVMGNFNMKGKNRGDANKKKFEDKRICKAIVESVRPQHAGVTEAAIKEQIGNVLKFAPFANGRKTMRETGTENNGD